MFLVIDRTSETISVNLSHVGAVRYLGVRPGYQSRLDIRNARGGELLSFEGADADAVRASLEEALASGKVMTWRCDLRRPPEGGR